VNATLIDTTEGRAKLANLEAHLPGQPSHLYEYAKLVARYIPDPQGYIPALPLAEQMAIYDILHTMEHVAPALLEMPLAVLVGLSMNFGGIIEVAFGPEIAKEFAGFLEETKKKRLG